MGFFKKEPTMVEKTKNKMTKKKGNLKSEYKESWNYIKDSRFFIYAVIIIFFLFAFLGFFISLPESVAEQLLNFFAELLKKTEGMSHIELIKFIFFNNLQSSFLGMIFGAVLGIFPVLSAIANGYILGFASFLSVGEGGFLVLWRLLPHGIFELPAVFISLGLGVKLGTFIFHKNKTETFKEYLFKSLKVFFLIVLPLLILAGIIEGSLIFLAG